MIDLSHDPKVTDALLHWRGKAVWPTDLSSAELRSLSVELRARAVFSARVTCAEFLGEVQTVVDEMLAGTINQATGRLRLMQKLRRLGYTPQKGFRGQGEAPAVPPAEPGSLQDLSSRQRLDLILETNMRMAANYGRLLSGNLPQARYAYPAWELVRLYLRRTPRGTPESHTDGWQQRWAAAGAEVGWKGAVRGTGVPPVGGDHGQDAHATQMIALKDSPIWPALGDGAGGYIDTLLNPFPPFAFGSGMAWRPVARAECQALGLITAPGQVPAPVKATLTPGEEAISRAIDKLPPNLRAALEARVRAKYAPATV